MLYLFCIIVGFWLGVLACLETDNGDTCVLFLIATIITFPTLIFLILRGLGLV